MARSSTAGRVVIADLTGGRNGIDPPWAIGDTQCVDMVNVDLFRTRFARKRNGGASVSLTFSSGGPFGSFLATLIRHVPASDPGAAELWAVDGVANVGRLAGGATWTAPTFLDTITASAVYYVKGASINGHLMLAYKSAVARHHVWDTATVRRTGLAATGAPTAADGGGGGAYPAVLRYYRQRSTRQSGGVTIGRSEPSASVAFTPSGANANATVTQATVINEGETHWEVEASIDGVTFYRIATVVIGTTTYADTAATTTYNTNPLSAATGTYTLQKPYKFIAVDQNRQLGFGSWTATDKQSRIEFSAVIGSLDVADEERVDTTTNYYVDLDESDSGNATGLAGPVLGSFFAFKLREIAQLTPTGNTAQPYSVKFISKSIGAISDRAILIGEDESGNPCLYWMSLRGPYRWGTGGMQYIGRDVEDLILGSTGQMTIVGDNTDAHGVYHQDKRQVWWWFGDTTSGAIGGVALIIFDVVHQSWTRYTGTADSNLNEPIIQRQTCSVMFSNTIGSSMSIDLKPYGGFLAAALSPVLTKWDSGTSDLTASGSAGIKAFVTTKAYEPGGPGFQGEIGDPMIVAAASAGVTVTATVVPDFGAITGKSGTALLTASGSESHVMVRMADARQSGASFYQHTIGDAAATTGSWTVERFDYSVARHESNAP